MIVLGLDFETTSKFPESTEITEVGAVLWDTKAGHPLIVSDVLVKPIEPMSDEVIKLTGIDQDMVNRFGGYPKDAITMVRSMMVHAEALVAHNGTIFDFPILDRYAMDFDVELPKLIRIDTMVDVPYPATMTSRKLTHLAVDHYVAPMFAHRAMFDVIMMLQILEQYKVEEIADLCGFPIITVVAFVGFNDKDLAKAAGFHFENDHGQKEWIKSMRSVTFDKEKITYPFRYAVR